MKVDGCLALSLPYQWRMIDAWRISRPFLKTLLQVNKSSIRFTLTLLSRCKFIAIRILFDWVYFSSFIVSWSNSQCIRYATHPNKQVRICLCITTSIDKKFVKSIFVFIFLKYTTFFPVVYLVSLMLNFGYWSYWAAIFVCWSFVFSTFNQDFSFLDEQNR